ncbi:hypothetical protein [Paenibacillus abyssi]|uniref:DUF3221 domain-containing protein n=1 Tax=Paenibacillus abyssi TaxID=1340531 RepID=A0A917FYM6_9BACL|nr:hypothetical protein [Paenibacillus abyssi]GGG14338.1 hypothetical protein GCM10010916_34070 [Paenibacillus abyssi]
MKSMKIVLCFFIALSLVIAGCASKPYGHYSDDEMIGFISHMNEQEQTITFDITEWMKRDMKGPDINDWGAEFTAQITPSTIIEDEDGKTFTWKELENGHKVQIIPVMEGGSGTPDKLLILSMSKEEM